MPSGGQSRRARCVICRRPFVARGPAKTCSDECRRLHRAAYMRRRRRGGVGAVWSAKIESRLGQVPDAVVAKELGITRAAVHARRKKLGIPAARFATANTAEVDRRILSGEAATTIAADLGVSVNLCRRRRRELGAKYVKPTKIDWRSADWSKSNAEIARSLGVSQQQVSAMRQRRLPLSSLARAVDRIKESLAIERQRHDPRATIAYLKARGWRESNHGRWLCPRGAGKDEILRRAIKIERRADAKRLLAECERLLERS